MIQRISVMQPVGDAAGELRGIIPSLSQADAVTILRGAETGMPWTSAHYSVTYDNRRLWWLVTPED